MTRCKDEDHLAALGELYLELRDSQEYGSILEEKVRFIQTELADLRREKRERENADQEADKQVVSDEAVRLTEKVQFQTQEIENLRLELASAYSDLESVRIDKEDAEAACTTAAVRIQELEVAQQSQLETAPSALPTALIERDKARQELAALKTDSGVAARHLERALRRFDDEPDKSLRSIELALGKLKALGIEYTEEDDGN